MVHGSNVASCSSRHLQAVMGFYWLFIVVVLSRFSFLRPVILELNEDIDLLESWVKVLANSGHTDYTKNR